uniref:Attractin/MKLN-like beta-propeller domain-containing protein n=1 Tax=Setaria digitata TaxID=48799 RepID=A0A915PCC9_9BILA
MFCPSSVSRSVALFATYSSCVESTSSMICAPAAERNKQPILDILKQYVDNEPRNFLEIASGSGQHICHFAPHFPKVLFQPSEIDACSLRSINLYIDHFKLHNVKKALNIDVRENINKWELSSEFQPKYINYLLNINMIHISSDAAVDALFKAAGLLLTSEDGLLFIYGPYGMNGNITPQSNVDFHRSLRLINPEWGLRDISLLEEPKYTYKKFCGGPRSGKKLRKIRIFNSLKAEVTIYGFSGLLSFTSSRVLTERSGMRMACDHNYVYVIGGFSPFDETMLSEEVWRFNVLTDNWELLKIPSENFPQEMASFAGCFFGDPVLSEFYMFGGTAVPFGTRASNSVNLLKRLKNERFTWKRLKTIGDIPAKLYGSCLVYYDKKLYLFGGTTGWEYNLEVRSLEPVFNGKAKQDANRLEPVRWKWTLLHDGSGVTGRYRHEAVLVDNEVVLIGGGTPEWTSPLKELLVFNISENKFRTQFTVPDSKYGYPMSRLYHGCVQFGNHAYILGGCTEKSVMRDLVDQIVLQLGCLWPKSDEGLLQRPKLLRDCWQLDLKKWRWKWLPCLLNQQLCFHAATVTPEGCIYVFGGTTDERFEKRTNMLQRCWIKPPSLFYIAARVIIKAYPLLSERFQSITVTNILNCLSSLLS